jgi:quinol monooxygenase YgiN
VYKTKADLDAHRQTPHLAHYLAHIDEYLVEPRSVTRYWSVFPTDEGAW